MEINTKKIIGILILLMIFFGVGLILFTFILYSHINKCDKKDFSDIKSKLLWVVILGTISLTIGIGLLVCANKCSDYTFGTIGDSLYVILTAIATIGGVLLWLTSSVLSDINKINCDIDTTFPIITVICSILLTITPIIMLTTVIIKKIKITKSRNKGVEEKDVEEKDVDMDDITTRISRDKLSDRAVELQDKKQDSINKLSKLSDKLSKLNIDVTKYKRSTTDNKRVRSDIHKTESEISETQNNIKRYENEFTKVKSMLGSDLSSSNSRSSNSGSSNSRSSNSRSSNFGSSNFGSRNFGSRNFGSRNDDDDDDDIYG